MLLDEGTREVTCHQNLWIVAVKLLFELFSGEHILHISHELGNIFMTGLMSSFTLSLSSMHLNELNYFGGGGMSLKQCSGRAC